MGNKNVTITGKFEVIKYKVEYRFYDTVLPDNSDNYLPETKTYKPGEIIKLENVVEPSGYKFLGWYKEDNFTMPNSDVIIYGEWKKVYGLFEPKIEIDIINKKDGYKVGDKVEYIITITNPEEFDIKDVIVSENNKDVIYIENEHYIKETDDIVTIPIIKAGEKVYLYSNYIVKESDTGIINNEVEIIGALSDNNYELKDKEYKANIDFKVIDENKNEEKTDNPITLDNIYKYIAIFSIAVLGIVILFFIKKKLKK